MGLRKQMAWFSLLLLMVLFLKNPRFVDGHARLNKFRTGSPSSSSEFRDHLKQKQKQQQGQGFFTFNRGGNNAEEKGDEFFGADKRKIHTGPNPLHNR